MVNLKADKGVAWILYCIFGQNADKGEGSLYPEIFLGVLYVRYPTYASAAGLP